MNMELWRKDAGLDESGGVLCGKESPVRKVMGQGSP